MPALDANLVGVNLPNTNLVGLTGTFKDSQRALILQALHAARWIVRGPSGAAARLGLNRTTLIAKMKKLGISRPVREDDIGRLSESRGCEPLLQPTTE